MSTKVETKCDGCGKVKRADQTWAHLAMYSDGQRDQHWCSPACKVQVMSALETKARIEAEAHEKFLKDQRRMTTTHDACGNPIAPWDHLPERDDRDDHQ